METKLATKVLMGAVIVVAGIFFSVAQFSGLYGSPVATRGSVAENLIAPSFGAVTLDGKTIRVPDDFKGKLILLDFWATWCGPCVNSIPGLVRVSKEFEGKPLVIISVSLDESQGVAESFLREFVKKKGMNWRHIFKGADEVANQFGIEAIPALFLIDGDTRRIIGGADDAESGLSRMIDRALAEKAGR